MKQPFFTRQATASATLTPTLLGIVACWAVFALVSVAADPGWWSLQGRGSQSAVMVEQVVTNGGIISTNYVPNDNAVVVQGQLKQFTVRAVDHMNANLTNGAGTNLNAMVTNWAEDYATHGYNSNNIEPSDYTVMTVGQLKYIGNKVWSRLVEEGYTNAVPAWLARNTNTDNTVAVLGQLKEIFNFDASTNTISSLAAAYNTDGSLTLSWTMPGSGTGDPVTLYGQNADGSWTVIMSLGSQATSGTLTAPDAAAFQKYAAGNAAAPAPLPAVDAPPLPASSTPNPAWLPVPRYVVIDFGTNFIPAGLNNSGVVVGNTGVETGSTPAIWDWTSNTASLLQTPSSSGIFPGSTVYSYFYGAVGIDDAGHIVGDYGWEDMPGEGLESGCYWSTSTSTPSLLGERVLTYQGTDLQCVTTAVSAQGYIVGGGVLSGSSSIGTAAMAFNPFWTVGITNIAQVIAPTNYTGNSLGPIAWANGASGATNWCGTWWTNGVTYPIINGTPYTSSTNSGLVLNSINDSNVAVGWNSTGAVLASPGPGNTLLTTNLGPGLACYINSHLDTNGAPAPQVLGYDQYDNPMLWDKFAPDGMPTGTYVGKYLDGLIANPTNGTYLVYGVNGMNNGSAIIATASFTSASIPWYQQLLQELWNLIFGPSPSETHGVLLLPDQITLNGYPISATNNTVCVGEQVCLTNFVSGVSPGAVTSYRWAIPGVTFKNYGTNSVGHFTGVLTTNSPSDLANSYVNTYWADGGTNRVIYCTNVIYGQTNVMSATINVQRPVASIDSSECNATATVDANDVPAGYAQAVHFGDGLYTLVAFRADITPPSGFTTGHYVWIQIINNVSASIVSGGQTFTLGPGTDVLDDPAPYAGLIDSAFGDFPSLPLKTGQSGGFSADNFTTYLMWEPNTPNAQYVPVRKISWGWTGYGTYVSGTTWTASNLSGPGTLSDLDTTNHPTWTQTFHQLQWSPYDPNP